MTLKSFSAIVFLCRCFGEIDRAIDLKRLARRIARSRSIAAVEIRDSLCLVENLDEICRFIEKTGADRVLIAACSGRARGANVIGGLARQMLHPANIELVDLREGCAWIHEEKSGITYEKAMNLIDMGLAALEFKGKTEDTDVDIRSTALVIGAGPAGLAAAISLGKLGIPVHIVERKSEIGGMLTLISSLYTGNRDPDEILSPLLEALESDSRIKISTKSRVTSVDGTPGNFNITLSTPEGERRFSAGAIIVACGARPVIPQGYYRYGRLQNIISQMELEGRLAKALTDAKRIVFIQCVAARCKERPYCSTICCPSSLKNAMRVMAAVPGAEAVILHRDIMTQGVNLEDYYRRAMSLGVRFIRFDPENPPRIEGEHQVEAVNVYDVLSGKDLRLDADMVVLSTPLAPHEENGELARILGLRLDCHGFFSGSEPMHPLTTFVNGVFLCGSARWPVSADQAVLQGRAAAMKAFGFLTDSSTKTASAQGCIPGPTAGLAFVDTEICSGCGNCVAACPFQACSLLKSDQSTRSFVDKIRCKGCGTCMSVCLNGAIQIPENNTRRTREMIKSAFSRSGIH